LESREGQFRQAGWLHKYRPGRNARLGQSERGSVAVSATRGSRRTALPIGGCHMTRMIRFSAPILTLGVLFALPAQAEDTMKKDDMHMSKPEHHMKKGAMMHKDNMMHKDSMMKKDTIMKDDTQK
jgi:pentapeptide MXKDX repeat protein